MSRADVTARSYTAEQKAEAVRLATSVGPKRAGEQLGIPGRTVAYWMHQPSASPIIVAAEVKIADRLRAAHAEALQAVMDGVRDPRSRLGDRATALRVLGEQLALAEGRSSLNIDLHAQANPIDALSPEDAQQLAQVIDAVVRHDADSEALAVALEDPLNLSTEQITGLIRAIEAKIGSDD